MREGWGMGTEGRGEEEEEAGVAGRKATHATNTRHHVRKHSQI